MTDLETRALKAACETVCWGVNRETMHDMRAAISAYNAVMREAPHHDLYKTDDADAPDVIKDRNGEVVLGLCRRCGKAEIELDEPCDESQPELEGLITEYGQAEYAEGRYGSGNDALLREARAAIHDHVRRVEAETGWWATRAGAFQAGQEKAEAERDAAIAERDDALKQAQRLAVVLVEKHHGDNKIWQVGDDLRLVIDQIDNAVALLISPAERDAAIARAERAEAKLEADRLLFPWERQS